jgi:hypothetical protein
LYMNRCCYQRPDGIYTSRGVQFKLSRTSSGKITLLSTERTGNMAIYAAYLPPRHCEPAG